MRVPFYIGAIFPFLYIRQQNIVTLGSATTINSGCRLWRFLKTISKKGGKEIELVFNNYSWVYVTIMLILRPLAYDLLSLIVIRSFDASYFSRNYSLTSNYWCKVLYNIIFWYFNVLSLIDDILIFIPGIGYLPSLFFAWSVLPGGYQYYLFVQVTSFCHVEPLFCMFFYFSSFWPYLYFLPFIFLGFNMLFFIKLFLYEFLIIEFQHSIYICVWGYLSLNLSFRFISK